MGDAVRSNDGAKSVLKRPRAIREDYEVRTGDGWTLNDNTFEQIPQSKRFKVDVPYPVTPARNFRSMFGLSTLQISYNAPITMTALDVATEHLWHCLPPQIQELVLVLPPNGPDLWGSDQNIRSAMYKKMGEEKNLDDTRKTYWLYPELQRRPWVIWPLWIEDDDGKDFMVAVWNANSDSTSQPRTYNRIDRLTIYDPRRSTRVDNGRHRGLRSRVARVHELLREFLQFGGYNTSKYNFSNGLMSPMPLGEATSGERCFAAVKELLHNITSSGGSNFVEEPVRALSRWVNPYQYRIEMAGINAWVLMSTLDYNARIAVECLVPNARSEYVVDGQRRFLQPDDLAGPEEHPLMADRDYNLAPA